MTEPIATANDPVLLPPDLAVSVVVPSRNAGPDLGVLLESLAEQTLPRERFEVVIGDDGSDDGSTNSLRDDGWIRVIPGPPRNSYAARNRAVASASARVLAFCDADCRPEPTWLESGLVEMERADIVAGSIRFTVPARRTVWSLLDVDMFLDQEGRVRQGMAVTANLFVRRSAFDAVGGFDESLPSGGDAVFVHQAVALGNSLVYSPNAAVWHPTRDRAGEFLAKVWRVQRAYAERLTRHQISPPALNPRWWIPVVGMRWSRARLGRTPGLDPRRLAAHGVTPTRLERALAASLLLLLPYWIGAAQLQGWRRERRRVNASKAQRPM